MTKKLYFPLGLSGLLLLSACQTIPDSGSSVSRDVSSSPMPPKVLPETRASESRPLASYDAVQFQQPTGSLTLRQALALVVLRSPQLVTSSYDIRAAEARRLQAGLIPNPEIEIGADQFAGTGIYRGYGAAETTLRLGQLVELGGKRELRSNVADRGRDLANWDYEAKRLDVLLTATQAYVDVIAAQRMVALSEDASKLSQRVLDTVSERIKAGQISPLERTRAQVVLSTNQLAVDRARRDLRISREKLASMWGSTRVTFTEAQGDFETLKDIPELVQLNEKSGTNPDLARWSTELAHREESLKLEKAKNIPDPTLSVGVTRFEETQDSALIVGLSLPLPLFGINPGGVQEAEAALAQSIAAQRETEIRISTDLSGAYQVLVTSHSQVLALQNDVLPAAEQAFAAAQDGYRIGRTTFLDVLDAQRALLEARGSYIESLADYHKSLAEVERLIGQPL